MSFKTGDSGMASMCGHSLTTLWTESLIGEPMVGVWSYVHTGRKLNFDLTRVVEFPCRERYLRGNETSGGAQWCLDQQREAEAVEDAMPEL